MLRETGFIQKPFHYQHLMKGGFFCIMTENYRYTNTAASFGMASPTMAYKANSILKANGFSSSVVKLSGSKNGCVYGVSVNGNADDAYALLLQSGISPTSVQR